MLLSVALIILVGMSAGWIMKKIKLPGLVGMLLTGILLGPYVLDLIDPTILNISADIRKIALIIILTRAGLGLDLRKLKSVGRSALMMCFVPATLEFLGVLLLGPWLLHLSYLESAILGAVLAAVSPAVVVPRMVKLMEEGYGTDKGIPEMILAGASVDDVYVIVLFTTFTGIASGGTASVLSFINIPVSVILGILAGVLLGFLFAKFFAKVHMRDTAKVAVVLSVSFLLTVAESALKTPITFSALIGIMFIGVALRKFKKDTADKLSEKYGKMWVVAEVFLFVLVGATVDIKQLTNVGAMAVLLLIGALAFRMLGVFLCVLGTKLSWKERLFTMLAYTPKATVQAAIGGIPLAMGLSAGHTILIVAVLAIVITAPLGAFAMDLTYKRLLKNEV